MEDELKILHLMVDDDNFVSLDTVLGITVSNNIERFSGTIEGGILNLKPLMRDNYDPEDGAIGQTLLFREEIFY